MRVSNGCEAQAAAVSAGVESGFGKDELHDRQTREKRALFLEAK